MNKNFFKKEQFFFLLTTLLNLNLKKSILVKNEQHFKDQNVLFKWTIEDPLEEFYEHFSSYLHSMVQAPLSLGNPACISLLPYSVVQVVIEQFCTSSMLSYYSSTEINSLPKMEDWQNAIFLLSTLSPDSLLKVILSKS